MKSVLIIIAMLIPSFLFSQNKDSVLCLNKGELITLANKIQLIQDSSRYKSNIIVAQDGLIQKLEKRVNLFEDQLKNKDEIIVLIEKQNVLLKDQVESLRPKWYNDNRLWFGFGVATTVFIVWGIK